MESGSGSKWEMSRPLGQVLEAPALSNKAQKSEGDCSKPQASGQPAACARAVAPKVGPLQRSLASVL